MIDVSSEPVEDFVSFGTVRVGRSESERVKVLRGRVRDAERVVECVTSAEELGVTLLECVRLNDEESLRSAVCDAEND